MLWIALTLPDLCLQVFTRGVDDPGALAVVEHRPRQRLVAATAAALARGVEPGTSVAGALAVAPDLELRERDEVLEHDTLDAFATWAGSFTPNVSIDPPAAIVLEVSSCLRLFGGLAALADRLAQGAARLGLDIRLAAAPTPLAARWLAEAKPGALVSHSALKAGASSPRFRGAFGSDNACFAGPDMNAGACVRPVVNDSLEWPRCLEALPLWLLASGSDVSPATLELLHGIGARNLGDVARLPRDGLARRQGAGVMQVLARARGDVPDPRRWHTPPERFESRLVLPAPVTTSEPLLFAARRLIAALSIWLSGLHAAIDRCCLHLMHGDRPATVLTVITGQPSRDEARLVMLVREHLAALKLDAPVEALRLCADNPVLHLAHSADLFGDPAQATDSASLLLDRLRARLGGKAVHSLRPWPDHRPERGWRESEPRCNAPLPQARQQSEPGCADTPPPHRRPSQARCMGASSSDRRQSEPATAHDTGGPMPPRPLWLLPIPQPLASVRTLTLVSGPERLESGWWDGAEIRRDYYVARAPAAGLWWIFQCLDRPGNWYVHGYFG